MENWLLGVVSEELSKLIVGFRKEQVTASLLTGKGEITDVELNVSAFNHIVRREVPFVELESVHVTRLAFNVTSFANIKRAPIEIIIDEAHAKLVEPLEYKQSDWDGYDIAEYVAKAARHPPYGLFDRIGDNVTLDIGRLYFTFQPMGKFKTRRPGPWTPPALTCSMHNLRYVSVDEYGEEGTPEAVWRHNVRRRGRGEQQSRSAAGGGTIPERRSGTVLVYKKLSMRLNAGIKLTPTEDESEKKKKRGIWSGRGGSRSGGLGFGGARAGGSTTETEDGEDDSSGGGGKVYPLLRDAPVEVHFAFERRKRDAALLAVQCDVTVNNVEVEVESETLPHLAHVIVGLQHAACKDRSFVDPLLSKQESRLAERRRQLQQGGRGAESVEVSLVSSDRTRGGPGQKNSSRMSSFRSEESSGLGVSISHSETNSKSEEDYKHVPEELLVDEDDDDEDDGGDLDETESGTISESGHGRQSASSNQAINISGVGTAVVLPSGLTIHEKLSFSLSVHHCSVRVWYPTDVGGHLQMTMKGLIAELIWPKITGERGGYAQISMSYVSLNDKHGNITRPLFFGGILPDDSQTKSDDYVNSDSYFPLFESRSIRDDPIGLRHSFPAQTLGVKCTIDMPPDPADKDFHIKVLNEVGVDRLEVILESDAWCRALCVFVNEAGGFDPRWTSADWRQSIKSDMLVSPSSLADFEACTQGLPQFSLDDNHMISSQFLNGTARVTRCELRVPAAIQKDVRSSDIIVSVDQAMAVVTSALPRSFLGGEISGPCEDARLKDAADFPNDPSDLCFNVAPDASPAEGTAATRRSNFRVQVNVTDIATKIVPVIPFHDAEEPQWLVRPMKTTLLASLEFEAPASGDDEIKSMAIYLSILMHDVKLNVDFEVLASAAGTVLHHTHLIHEAISTTKFPTRVTKPSDCVNVDTADPNKIKGRKALVKKQMIESKQTGGLRMILCMHVTDLELDLWRQNCPLPGQALVEEKQLVLLLRLRLSQLEFGAEAFEGGVFGSPDSLATADHMRNMVAKCRISQFVLALCDYQSLCSSRDDQKTEGGLEDAKESVVDLAAKAGGEKYGTCVDVLSIGINGEDAESGCISCARLEYQANDKSLAGAVEVGTGSLEVRLDCVERVAVLLVEAFLMPAGSSCLDFCKVNASKTPKHSTIFPDGSIGYFLESMAKKYCLSSGSPGSANTSSDTSSLTSFAESFDRTLLRLHAEEFSLIVPATTMQDSSDVAATPSKYCLKLTDSSALAGYFDNRNNSDEYGIMKTLGGGDGCQWNSFFRDEDTGYHYIIRSKPQLFCLRHGNETTPDTLIAPFRVDCYKHPSKIDASLGQCALSFKETKAWNQFCNALLECGSAAESLVNNIPLIVSSVKKREVPSGGCEIDAELSPFYSACEDSTASCGGALSLLADVKHSLGTHEKALGLKTSRKQAELDQMRLIVFMKERQRLAAHALLASSVSGWIRMGGGNQSRQRVVSTTSLWKYFAVLRKSMLIILPAPGKTTPIDVISLRDVKLQSLEGGRRKSETEKGFAIVDSKNKVYFLVCQTRDDYEMWVGMLKRTINSLRDPSKAEPKRLMVAASVDDAGDGAQDEVLVTEGGNEEANADNLTVDDVAQRGVNEMVQDDSEDAVKDEFANADELALVESNKSQDYEEKIVRPDGTATHERLEEGQDSAIADGETSTSAENLTKVEANASNSKFTDGQVTAYGEKVASLNDTPSDILSGGAKALDELTDSEKEPSLLRSADLSEALCSDQEENDLEDVVDVDIDDEPPQPELSPPGHVAAAAPSAEQESTVDSRNAQLALTSDRGDQLKQKLTSVRGRVGGSKSRFGVALQSAKGRSFTSVPTGENASQEQGVSARMKFGQKMKTMKAKSVVSATARVSKIGEAVRTARLIDQAPAGHQLERDVISVADTATLASAGDSCLPLSNADDDSPSVARDWEKQPDLSAEDRLGNEGLAEAPQRVSFRDGNVFQGMSKIRQEAKTKLESAVKTGQAGVSKSIRKLPATPMPEEKTLEANAQESTDTRGVSTPSESNDAQPLVGVNKRETPQTIDTPQRSRRLKAGMTKFKSAVQSVKLDSQVLRELNTTSFQHPDRTDSIISEEDGTDEIGTSSRKSRFSGMMLSSRLSSSEVSDKSVVKIKSLRVGGEDAAIKDDAYVLGLIEGWSKFFGIWEIVVKRTDTPVGAETESSNQAGMKVKQEQSALDAETGSATSRTIARGGLASTSAPTAANCFDWQYLVEIRRLDHDNGHQEHSVCKTISDILSLQTAISSALSNLESVGFDVSPSFENISDSRLALLDQVMSAGKMLGGSLEAVEKLKENDTFWEYHCEILDLFLNAVLSSPLPSKALSFVTDFLHLGNVDEIATIATRNELGQSVAVTDETNSSHDSVLRLLSKCQAELVRAQGRGRLAAKLAAKISDISHKLPDHVESSAEVQTKQSVSEAELMHVAMHKQLMSVMSQRDDAHAQLVSSSVLHVHEMETERRKIELLTKKLEVAEKLNSGGGRLFAGREDVAGRKSLLKFEKESMQNTDAELLEMCRQLSSEISAKTSASLENVRLKESRKIEHDRHTARQKALEDEVKRCKKQLREEQKRSVEAKKAALGWKQSFDEVAKSAQKEQKQDQLNGK